MWGMGCIIDIITGADAQKIRQPLFLLFREINFQNLRMLPPALRATSLEEGGILSPDPL